MSYNRNEVTSPILGEEEIVWLLPQKEIDRLAFVREMVVYAASRRGPIKLRGKYATLVGYSTIRRGCQTRGIQVGCFIRRMWFLKGHDRIQTGGGRAGAPCEAVDPSTVAPGVPGQRTERVNRWRSPVHDKGEEI
jgi:Family of unknown function (DUF6009)